MSIGLRADLGTGLEFNTGAPDAYGITWYMTELQGWDAPSLRRGSMPLTARDGQGLGSANWEARAVILKGVAKATTLAEKEASRERLMGLISDLNNDINLLVYETIPKYVPVRLGGKLAMQAQRLHYEFEIPLIGRYPVKLGAVAIGPSIVNIDANNVGTWITYPTFTFTAAGTTALANHTITGSPSIAATVAVGDVLDLKNHTLKTAGGVDKYNAIDLADTTWWGMIPGINQITTSVGCTIIYRSAWI